MFRLLKPHSEFRVDRLTSLTIEQEEKYALPWESPAVLGKQEYGRGCKLNVESTLINFELFICEIQNMCRSLLVGQLH